MDLSALRRHYSRDGLRREDLPADPIEQFSRWLQQACEAGLVEPNAMVLATSLPEARPTQRTVLLKSFDDRGFVFFTNFESRKARQITSNPHVSLLFPWFTLERQVAITGEAVRIPASESLKYFLKRPVESQLGAWASPQSSVISSRSLLDAKFAEMKAKFKEGRIPLPSFWGGYRVVPHTIEFWQGGGHRLHDRFLYTKEAEAWQLARLAP
ncbi:MAG: pyridoxamine 5'-phosphate oxidase [Verrucomicrobia bacterium]|nr:pyridoxamine 5'-phosphate oxidase [Verrucomicrobiota bacterium]